MLHVIKISDYRLYDRNIDRRLYDANSDNISYNNRNKVVAILRK